MSQLAIAPDPDAQESGPPPATAPKSASGSTPYPAWAKFFKKTVDKVGSQGDVSERLNVSQTQISRWVRGLARPATMDAALDIVAKLGGDVQAAQAAWNADVARPRGRAAKAVKKAAGRTGRKPGPKPGSKRSTAVQPASQPSATPPPARRVGPPSSNVPADVVLEGVAMAQRALKEAEQQLDEAVAAARAAGLSWPAIGEVLRNG